MVILVRNTEKASEGAGRARQAVVGEDLVRLHLGKEAARLAATKHNTQHERAPWRGTRPTSAVRILNTWHAGYQMRMDRAGGTRQNDGQETGIMGAAAARLAWGGLAQ